MTTTTEPMPASAYTLLDSGAYRASLLTRGPWHQERPHAGQPTALVCRAIELAAMAQFSVK